MQATGNTPTARKRGGILVRVCAVLALTVFWTALQAGAAQAETFTVTNTSNGGAGSLRAAITRADYTEGADRVVFADGVGGTITLGSRLPMITDPAGLEIDGGGDVTVSGNDAVQVFVVGRGAALSLSSLTVSDGSDALRGGGIRNDGGTVEVTDSAFSGNDADFGFGGGGIYNDEGGALTISNSTFSGNAASYGGGVFNDEGGTLTVTDSTFSANHAGDYGGGVFNDRDAELTVSGSTFSGNETGDLGAGIANFGTLGVTDTAFSGGDSVTGGGIHNEAGGTVEVGGSTFSGNSAILEGGGVSNFGGTLGVTNSTFSGNRSGEGGGGIFSSGDLEVTNSTLHGNEAFFGGGGVHNSRGTATLRNAVVADNAGSNCGGPITDGGYNVDDDGTCGLTLATGSLPNTDPLLDPDGLQDNGGPTETVALLPDSPAVDLVADDACPPPQTDQRGIERPQGEACDSGAYELVQGPPRPQTKADCKRGGWREYGFKNRGRCIAFVNRAATDR